MLPSIAASSISHIFHGKFSTCINDYQLSVNVCIKSINKVPSPQRRFTAMAFQHFLSLIHLVHAERLLFILHFMLCSYMYCIVAYLLIACRQIIASVWRQLSSNYHLNINTTFFKLSPQFESQFPNYHPSITATVFKLSP